MLIVSASISAGLLTLTKARTMIDAAIDVVTMNTSSKIRKLLSPTARLAMYCLVKVWLIVKLEF